MINRERSLEVKEIYDRQVDRVYRTAMIYTKNPHDAEDVVQSVFCTIIAKDISFENEEHERAWCILAAKNKCKDMFKSSWRSKVDLKESAEQLSTNAEGAEDNKGAWTQTQDNLREAQKVLMMLPTDQREIVYLHYYEGYTLKEISEMLDVKESKLRSALASAKRAIRSE